MKTPLSILLINQEWFKPELTALGHTVKSVSLGHAGFDVIMNSPGVRLDEVLKKIGEEFSPDRIVYFDNSAPPWILGLEDSPATTIFYSVDAHHHVLWHVPFAQIFDCVLVGQKDYVGPFAVCHSDARWFPLWAPMWDEPSPVKDIDVSFRGNMNSEMQPERVRFFEELRNYIEIDAKSGVYAPIYARSKIVVNESIRGDLNFRVFEAMASGALLINPNIGNGLLDLFTDGEDLVTYEGRNAADAAEKVRYYLANEELRARIARNGWRKVHSAHTAAHRANEFEQVLYSVQTGRRRSPQFSGAQAALYLASVQTERLDRVCSILRYAKEKLVESARKCELATEELFSTAVLCRCSLEFAGLQNEATEFTTEFADRFPEDETTALFQIEDLIHAGRNDLAFAIAEKISNNPKEFVGCATEVLTKLRERVKLGA